MDVDFEALDREVDKLILFFKNELYKEESEPVRKALELTKEFRKLLKSR